MRKWERSPGNSAEMRSTVLVSCFKTRVVPPHCSNKTKNIAPRKSHQEWTPRKVVDKVSAPEALFDPTNYVLPLRVAITCSLVAVPHLPFAPFMLRPFTGSSIKGVGGSLCQLPPPTGRVITILCLHMVPNSLVSGGSKVCSHQTA